MSIRARWQDGAVHTRGMCWQQYVGRCLRCYPLRVDEWLAIKPDYAVQKAMEMDVRDPPPSPSPGLGLPYLLGALGPHRPE